MSTLDQHVENQLQELRTYCERRGWTATEFIDQGVSGAKERSPALDEMLKAAKRRKFDVLIVWRLDRLGGNLRHLILLLDELHALGVAFVSLAEGIDATTPAGRLQLHVLGAIAEFERSRIQERVKAGLARVRAQGKKLGRPERVVDEERLCQCAVCRFGKPPSVSVSRLPPPIGGCLRNPPRFPPLNLQNTA